jgi:hypothetical protein
MRRLSQTGRGLLDAAAPAFQYDSSASRSAEAAHRPGEMLRYKLIYKYDYKYDATEVTRTVPGPHYITVSLKEEVHHAH